MKFPLRDSPVSLFSSASGEMSDMLLSPSDSCVSLFNPASGEISVIEFL